MVHTICYSVLLLNTDLYLADVEQKMTKNQFIRNTMPTVNQLVIDASDERSKMANGGTVERDTQRSLSPDETPSMADAGVSQTAKIAERRSSRGEGFGLITGRSGGSDGGLLLVNKPFTGSTRAWESQVEAVLKDFYTSIHKHQLPLHGSQSENEGTTSTSGSTLLGPSAAGTTTTTPTTASSSLRRSPSNVSKSGSDNLPRGRSTDSRHGTTMRFTSKQRLRPRLYPSSHSRTSLDEPSPMTPSSTWSKYSLGKLTSASVDSFGSGYARGDYQQSIGFANALSQAIIREDSTNSVMSSETDQPALLEDETLELAGAPWAKEGSLKHKHHLDSVDKRAKDRNWNECFAVIQQGWMRLFSFNSDSSKASLGRQKAKQRHPVVVGGGNWTENAHEVWKFLLRQTIASALPPPGYSKSRPHVWALSLPTGAVHLFQVGTPEIVREFVSTANYWSGRLSKEPLIGGVSNIEYGWSESVINGALAHADATKSPPASPVPIGRPSFQSSIRGSMEQQVGRPKLPADRIAISEWTPPQQSMVASSLSEPDQQRALRVYVKNVEDELQKHNELRTVMSMAFSPRHPNLTKAMGNWERKSSYLLREIVKFRTYIDTLQAAQEQKEKLYAPPQPSG